MIKNYLLGMVVGSVITAIVLYLPLAGLFGQFFIPGLLGILVVFALAVPGAVVAGLIVRGWRRGSNAGAVTALVGYLVLLIAIPELRPGPYQSFLINVGTAALLMIVAYVAGGLAGKIRKINE